MNLSPYFDDLRSAYLAELDDLSRDSEGNDVLRRRLQQKRAEIGFLVQMMDLSPEMVAVVFHQGFRFHQPKVLENLLRQQPEDLPAWDSLAAAITLEPWAQSLAQTVLREPQGATFMAVAAGLEYLHQHARLAAHAGPGHDAADADADDGETPEHDDDYDALSADDALEPQDSRSREEASANWLADVGFDRKD